MPGAKGLMAAVLYRPDGPGPFPLVILLPDAPADRLAARRQSDPMVPAARWFAGHGYAAMVVAPHTFGSAGGAAAIDAQSDDLDAVYGYLRVQNFVDAGRIVLAGEGTGGFAAMGLASRQPTGVMGTVNFAGAAAPTVAVADTTPAPAAGAGSADDGAEVDLLGGGPAAGGAAGGPAKLQPGAMAAVAPTPKAVAAKPAASGPDPVAAGVVQRYGAATHRPEIWIYPAGDAEARRWAALFNRPGSTPAHLLELPMAGGGRLSDQPTLWGDQVEQFLNGVRFGRG